MVRITKFEQLEKHLKSLNKTISLWKKMEILVLLKETTMTEKKVLHCLEMDEEMICDCSIHKGNEMAIYGFELWVKGEGKLANYPIIIFTYRRDQVIPKLCSYLLNNYEITEQEIEDEIFFRDFWIIHEKQMMDLEQIYSDIDIMKDKLEDYHMNHHDKYDKPLPKKLREQLIDIRVKLLYLKKNLKRKQLIEINYEYVIEKFDDLINSKKVTHSLIWNFIDEGNLQLDWIRDE